MNYLINVSFILSFFSCQSVYSQGIDYDNWSLACEDCISTIDINECFYKQRHIADSLMQDTYNKISVIHDEAIEEAVLKSDKELIQWYGNAKSSLSEGQEYWSKMSQADTYFTYNFFEGGSMSTMITHSSAIDASYKRLKVLSGFLELLNL